MVAALPHCDALVSGHSFAALGEVVAAIGGAPVSVPEAERGGAGGVGERDPGGRQLGGDAERARPEPRPHHAGMGDR